MSAKSMRELRRRASLTQAEMAMRLGLSYRGYQELEAERASFSERHRSMLERVSLRIAVDQGDISLALPSILIEVLSISSAIARLGKVP